MVPNVTNAVALCGRQDAALQLGLIWPVNGAHRTH
jgi:hypothetical protein